nr:MAG: internal scaffolding protein [Microvirus sp.]
MEIRKKYDDPVYQPITFKKVGRTKAEFKESCDVNYILKKYQKTGIHTQMIGSPDYGDFSNPVDYQEALNIQKEAESQFLLLPADLRKQLDNDPQKFLEYVQDEKNIDHLEAIGLVQRWEEPEEITPPIPEEIPE